VRIEEILTGVLNIKKELPICKSIWQNSAMIKPNYPKHVGMGEELLIISQGEGGIIDNLTG